jgi:hypothetical protein
LRVNPERAQLLDQTLGALTLLLGALMLLLGALMLLLGALMLLLGTLALLLGALALLLGILGAGRDNVTFLVAPAQPGIVRSLVHAFPERQAEADVRQPIALQLFVDARDNP